MLKAIMWAACAAGQGLTRLVNLTRLLSQFVRNSAREGRAQTAPITARRLPTCSTYSLRSISYTFVVARAILGAGLITCD